MSDKFLRSPVRIALIGATGLVGRSLIELVVGREDVRLSAIARREIPLPPDARMEMFVADPSKWGEIFEAMRPDVLMSALGTTRKKADGSIEKFREVDYGLVLDAAQSARRFGVERMIVTSSVGAAIGSRSNYLRVKGETERDLAKLGFHRLDILRPSLLRGKREEDRRPLETIGIAAAPFVNSFLHGHYRKYRAVKANDVARAALALSLKQTRGRYLHEYDSLMRLANSLPDPVRGMHP